MSYNSIDPLHYRGDRKFEPIEVIEDWKLNYRLGNALKYISRNGRKPGEDPIEGLKKSIWYLNREIEALKAEKNPYAVTYEDVLEDHAACSVESVENRLDRQVDLWDENVGPIEPIDFIGQSEWSDPDPEEASLKFPACKIDLNEIHKALDKFEDGEIVTTFERRGIRFGVGKRGETYVLGVVE